jgi:hypothetical protein
VAKKTTTLKKLSVCINLYIIVLAELEHPASRTLFARELSSAGTILGKVTAVDKDKDDKVTYEITGKLFVRNNNLFNL